MTRKFFLDHHIIIRTKSFMSRASTVLQSGEKENFFQKIRRIFSFKIMSNTNFVILVWFLFFTPMVSNWEYRSAFLSGDMAGFLTPYPV